MSEKENVQKIKLTGPQLCAAGQILGYERLLLPQDPFRGWLVEEIEESLIQAREELIEADLINPVGSEGIEVEENLLNAISALGSPKCSLMLNRATSKDDGAAIYFHYIKNGWVSVKQVSEGDYQLETLSDNALPTERLLGFLAIQNQSAAPGKTSTLSSEAYQEARELGINQGAEACEKFLAQASVGGSSCANLLIEECT